MLQKINERIQGIFAWAVIALIAFTFALFGVDYYLQARHANQTAFKVNGTSVSQQEFDLTYRRNQQYATDPASVKTLKKRLMNGMVSRLVSLDAAKAMGFWVSAKQAEETILNIPQFQEEGKFSAQRYQQALTSNLFTSKAFEQEVQQGMQLNQQRFAFMGTAFVLPEDVNRFISLYMQTRDYDYLQISPDWFLKEVHVNDAMIQHFYDTHQVQFQVPERVQVDYVTLSLSDIKKRIHITPAAITQYYEENQSSYMVNATTAKPLAQVSAEIEALLVNEKALSVYNQDLERLTELSYQTPDSLQTVSDELHLPILRSTFFTAKGDKTGFGASPKIVQVAFNADVLLQGNNSEPVQLTDDSVVVLRVAKRQPASQASLTQVRADIITQLQHSEARLAAQQFGERLEATPDNIVLQQRLKAYHAAWTPVQKASRESEKLPVEINRFAFALPQSVHMKGRVLDNGSYVLVRLRAVSPGDARQLDKEQIASLSQQLESSFGMTEYDLYMNQQLKTAVVVK